MINFLVCNPTVILQDVVVHRPRCLNKLFNYRLQKLSASPSAYVFPKVTYQDLAQLVIRNISQLLAMEFGDHELDGHQF